MENQGQNISGKHNIFNPKLLKRLGKRVTNNGKLVNNVKANAKANKSLKKKNAANTSRPSSPENPSENALGNPSPVAATPTGGRRKAGKSRKAKKKQKK
jgi:hypothetical protein